MKHTISEDTVREVLDELDELRDLLEERISELHKVQGAQADRHAFVYYRNKLIRAQYLFTEDIKNQDQEVDDGND